MMTPIEDYVRRLEIVLCAEEDVYRRLKAVLRREEGELVELDPGAVERTTAEKQALAAEARIHEESRIEVMTRLAALIGAPTERPRLSELNALLGDQAGPLPELHARLSALIAATRSLLSANERFANRSLSRVQDTLKLLGQAVPEPDGYGPGARAGKNGRGRLIRASI